MKHLILTFAAIFIFSGFSFSQLKNDSVFIRNIYDKALTEGKSYEDLRSLCKDVGARLAGSVQSLMAVDWGFQKLKSYGFDTVYLQEIKVPNWKRGNKESAFIRLDDGHTIPLQILALGGSIATNGVLSSDLVVFNSIEDLKKVDAKKVKDKVVFINEQFDHKHINTFEAYGTCAGTRHWCGIEAAKKGAIGVIIRSVSSITDEHPHTGGMAYKDSIPKIPGAAVSTISADLIMQKSKHHSLTVFWEMDCKMLDEQISYNVIAEIRGSKNPTKIITVGGHLDSWDVGEGAHDDGAGIVHSMEALLILKELNYKPNNTLRVVFFMNEENGNRGGISYSDISKSKNEEHIAAIESDRGGFAPRGFLCDGNDKQLKNFQTFEKIMKPYNLHIFQKGYGGVDINPLKKNYPNIALFGFYPDEQRYFDLHHTNADVFETVNKRELELGCAAVASLIYLLDNTFKY